MTRKMRECDQETPFLEGMMGEQYPIERQEARGQREACGDGMNVFLACDVPDGTDEQLLELGIRFEGEGDGVMRPAVLPEGWTLRPTEHSMWNELVDDRGRKRASMFYKAAYYDRKAHLRLECRYVVRSDDGRYDRGGKIIDSRKYHRSYVLDNETGCRVKEWDWLPEPQRGADGLRSWRSIREQRQGAEDWLTEYYPDHNDPMAYWS
jgi:hypothetical protein